MVVTVTTWTPLMFRQLLTIARNAFVESIRQPDYAVLVIVGIILLLLNPSLSAYTFEVGGGGDDKLMVDLSMSTIMLIGTLLAAFTAAGVISTEIENKTVLTTVSKPVARPTFVLGKFLGVAGAVAIGFWVLTIVFLLTVRHGVLTAAYHHFDQPVLTFGLGAGLIAIIFSAAANYYYRWVFTSTFIVTLAISQTIAWCFVLIIGKEWVIQSPLEEFTKSDSFLGDLHIALLLIFQGLMIITAVAIAASTRLAKVMTLIVTLVFWMSVQFISSQLAQFARVGDSVGSRFAGRLAPFVPNFQYLWQADAITQGHDLSAIHVLRLSLYSLLFLIAILSLAIAFFQTREVS